MRSLIHFSLFVSGTAATYSSSNTKKYKKVKKKAGKILITFKIRILRHCLTGYNQIRHHFLY